jgi:hypothetical protein
LSQLRAKTSFQQEKSRCYEKQRLYRVCDNSDKDVGGCQFCRASQSDVIVAVIVGVDDIDNDIDHNGSFLLGLFVWNSRQYAVSGLTLSLRP